MRPGLKYSIVDREKRKLLVPFILPAVLLYLVFFVYPALRAFGYSTTEWTGFNKNPEFVGFSNFAELASDSFFLLSLRNTIIIFFVGGLIIFAIAFLFTSILSSGIRGKRFYRAIIFLPYVLTPPAIATLWGFLTNPSFGMINSILTKIGLEQLARPWMAPEYIFKVLVAAIVWVNIGFYIVVFLSAISKIPQTFYDAAKVEGANEFHIFFKITIPMIYDILIVTFIYWGIISIKMFELVYSFTGVFPKSQMWTMAVYVYIMGFGGTMSQIYRLGYATAIAVILFLMIMVFVISFRFVASRRESIEY